MVGVEKDQKSVLTFYYKTREIVTDGVPVLQMILKQSDSDKLIQEIELLPENSDLIKTSYELKTNSKTKALEVKLTRKRCTKD